MATPYTDRNFLFASAEGRIDRFLPFFFKYTIYACFEATNFFLGPFHNFLASKWVVFSRGGSLSEICGQNLRNVGRTAVVIIICYQYSLNIKTTAHIFEILTTFFRKAFLEILNGLGELLYCTVMPLVKSLFQREEETAAQLIQHLDNEISSCVTIKTRASDDQV